MGININHNHLKALISPFHGIECMAQHKLSAPPKWKALRNYSKHSILGSQSLRNYSKTSSISNRPTSNMYFYVHTCECSSQLACTLTIFIEQLSNPARFDCQSTSTISIKILTNNRTNQIKLVNPNTRVRAIIELVTIRDY